MRSDVMLLSDSWQPAVLQLLPFSSNDALTSPTSQPNSAQRLRNHHHGLAPNSASSDSSRGFPVLAVTRGGGQAANGESRIASDSAPGAGLARSTPTRVSSERFTRSTTHAVVDPASSVHVNGVFSHGGRSKSEYHNRRSAGVRNSYRASQEEEHGYRYDNDELMRAAAALLDSSSSDMLADSGGGAALQRYSAKNIGGGGGGGANDGGGALPKPTYHHNALSPGNSSAAAVLGSPFQVAASVEGRYLVSKNGLWRSVTLTPGEIELKKHRDQLERGPSTRHQQLTQSSTVLHGVDGKMGHQYHKMNVRDLPRSTTPVNDHDPDKLNMKQVIAFLQSKGKSQAEAMELPRDVKVKVTQDIQFPKPGPGGQGPVRGQLRGSVRRPTVPTTSSAAEIVLRTSTKSMPSVEIQDVGEGANHSPSSPTAVTPRDSIEVLSGGYANGQTPRSPGEPRNLKPRSKSSGRAVSEYVPRREHYHMDKDNNKHLQHSKSAGGRARKSASGGGGGDAGKSSNKKPFRLHRFLSMVPSPRDAAVAAYATSTPTAYTTISTRPATFSPYESASRTKQKERTLCMDLANQSKGSKAQAGSQHKSHDENLDADSRSSSTPDGKVHYRVSMPASKPRPSSLRAEQDYADTHNKLSADFAHERPHGRIRVRSSDVEVFKDRPSNSDDNNNNKTVIRLPFVMVDSEDEENNAAGNAKTVAAHEHKRGEKTRPFRFRASNPSTKAPLKAKHELKGLRQSETEVTWNPETEGAWAENERNALANARNGLTDESVVDLPDDVMSGLRGDPTQSATSLIVHPTNSTTSMALSPLQSTGSMALSPYQSNSSMALTVNSAQSNSSDVGANGKHLAQHYVNGVLVDSTSSMNAEMDSALSLTTSFVIQSAYSIDNDSGSGENSHHSRSDDGWRKHHSQHSANRFAIDPVTSVTSIASSFSRSDVSNERFPQISGERSDTKLPVINGRTADIGVDNIYHDLHPKVAATRKVKVSLPSPCARQKRGSDVSIQSSLKPPDCVTLSLRKERNRTRESTYMSEIGGKNAFPDDTDADITATTTTRRPYSDKVRPSDRSASWAS